MQDLEIIEMINNYIDDINEIVNTVKMFGVDNSYIRKYSGQLEILMRLKKDILNTIDGRIEKEYEKEYEKVNT